MELQTPRLILRGYLPDDLAAVHRFASDPRLITYVEWGPNSAQDSRDFLAACRAETQQTPRRSYTFAVTTPDGGGTGGAQAGAQGGGADEGSAADEPFGTVGLTADPDHEAPDDEAPDSADPDDGGPASGGSRSGRDPVLPGASGSVQSSNSATNPRTGLRTGEIGYVIAADRWGRGYATEATAAVVHFGFHTLGLESIRATCRPGNTASARVLEKAGFTLAARLPAHKLIRGRWEDSLLYSVSRPQQHGAGTAGTQVRLL